MTTCLDGIDNSDPNQCRLTSHRDLLVTVLRAQAHEMQIAMMEAGLIPNVVDYFDVDTDPKGKLALWI